MARTALRRRGETRELILSQAEAAIAELGLDVFMLKDIAEPLGIKVPSIYAHFPGRDAVVAGVAERYIAALSHQFPDDGQGEPMAALSAGVGGLLIFFASNPAYVRLKLRDLETPGGLPELSAAAAGEPALNVTTGPVSEMFRRLQNILDRGVSAGVFRVVSVIDLYRLVFGTVLLSLTYPGQDLLTTRGDAAKVARILPFIDDVVRRYVAR